MRLHTYDRPLMPQHIFFSWQSDLATKTGRNLVERALSQAIATIKADAEIDPAQRELAIDRDTAGVPGSPPLVETIFAKVDRAAAFLSDLTYVGQRADGRRMPNPNVLLEHGWALKALTWRRVFSVMNVVHGHPDEHALPFDLQHFRRPIFYDCPDDADTDARRAARDGLAAQFVTALRAILTDEAAAAGQASAAPAEPHPHDVELLAQVRRQLTVGLQRFLHDHNFGEPFRRDILDPINEMNEDWRGARFEFHDPAIETAFADVRTLARQLGNLTEAHLWAMDANLALCSPKTDEDRRRGIQPSTLKAIGAMNEKASEFAASIDALERVARDRVRVSPVAAVAATAAVEDRGEAAAREWLESLAGDRAAGRLPGIVSAPSMTVRLVPLAIAERRRLDPKRVASAQLRFPPDAGVRVDTDSDGAQWWSIGVPHDVGKPNGESRWRTRLVRPGAIEFGATIGFRIDDDREIVIDGHGLEGEIAAAVERLGSIAAELDLAGPALVGIAFEGTEDVVLGRARPGGRKIRRPAFALPVALLDDPADRPANALHEQFDILWQVAGWGDGSPSFGSGDWDGYRDRGEMAAR
jgi:hypothetical protein